MQKGCSSRVIGSIHDHLHVELRQKGGARAPRAPPLATPLNTVQCTIALAVYIPCNLSTHTPFLLDFIPIFQDLVVSLFSLGSLVGALLGGPLSDWAGRRPTLLGRALLAASGIICSVLIYHYMAG